MKKLKNYYEPIFNLNCVDGKEDYEDVYKLIKQVQRDTIDYVVQRCADEAEMGEQECGILGRLSVVNKKCSR